MRFLAPDEYQTKCKERFSFFEAKVKILLPSARVEHIGASSIPNAISKGDLDIFVGVESNELESAVQLLLALGFTEKLNTLRTPELCMLDALHEDVALQVIASGSEFECFLKFRNKLRSDIELLKQYNEMKKSCVGLLHSDYQKRKSLFIEQVLLQG